MKTGKLGKTGIDVSKICLGTMTWGEQNSEVQAFEQMDYAISKGVNFWDTAELYPTPPNANSAHRTEEYIGNYFQSRNCRKDIILATKVTGPNFPWIREGKKLTPDGISEALEGSLKRLKTDYIDLYQIHWPNRTTYHFGRNDYKPEAGTAERDRAENFALLERMDQHVKEGKIRFFGMSDDTAWGVACYEELSRTRGLTRIVSVQNEYSLLCRHFDKDLQEISLKEEIGLLAWSPLATGALSGKYANGAIPKGSRRDYSGANFRDTENAAKAVDAYVALAKKYGIDPCAFALAFVLSRPFTTAAIIGATQMFQLEIAISSSEVTLPKEALDDIEAVHAQYSRYY